MGHYAGYIVSVGVRPKEPHVPDKCEYNENVHCEYSNRCSWTPEELAENFADSLGDFLTDADCEKVVSSVSRGTGRVVIPEGAVRRYVERDLETIKEDVDEMTADDLAHNRNAAYAVHCKLRFHEPFETTVVTIADGCYEDYDSMQRFLRQLIDDNDRKATTVWVWAAYNHHV